MADREPMKRAPSRIQPADRQQLNDLRCAGLPDTHPTLRLLALIDQQAEHLDLMVDEFHRIRAVAFDAAVGCLGGRAQSMATEIRGLCERAVEQTRQRVPLIVQRDRAETERDRLREALKLCAVAFGEDEGDYGRAPSFTLAEDAVYKALGEEGGDDDR